MAVIKKTGDKKVLARMWRKRNPPALLVGMYIGAATMENSTEVPQQTKIRMPCDPEIPLLGIYPKKL